MRIIPVVDLRGGRAVRGSGGNRGAYRPVRSVLASGEPADLSDPIELVDTYRRVLGSRLLYVADLDAIEGTGCNLAAIRGILEAAPTLRILLDAGPADLVGRIAPGLGSRIDPILATETLEALPEAPEFGASSGAVLGLDLSPEGVVARSPALAAWDEVDLLREARRRGMRRAIVLSLDRIGTSVGLHRHRLGRLGEAAAGIELIAGGGISGIDDLEFLKERGFWGALMATALHDGLIGPEALRAAGFSAA